MTRARSFPALNGLRFFAALAVVCYHYAPLTQGYEALPWFLHRFVSAGPIALGFFFILSGFVLSHAYHARLPATSATRHTFWLARVARLYPVYLLAFLLFLPIAFEKYLHHRPPGGIRTFCAGGLLSLFAVQAWTPLSQAWNGPSWSLSVEAFFYFLFPLIARRMLYASRQRVTLALIGLWISPVLIALAHQQGLVPQALWVAWIQNDPLMWTPLFLIGILTYRASDRWALWGNASATILGVSSLGLLTILCMTLPPRFAELMIVGGAAPLMAVIVLAFSHPTSLASRAAGVRILFHAGGLSYIVYILQAPVWHISRMAAEKLRHTHGPVPVWQFLLYILAMLGLSSCVQAWLEEPAKQWLLSRFATAREVQPILADPHIEAA